MRTQEILEYYKKENIHIPQDWAVIQDGTGKFVRFMSSEPISKIPAIEIEKAKTEKQAIKESKLSQL